MRTQWERSQFKRDAETRAADARVRGEDPRAALEKMFREELAAHPDEEDLLLELWDRLTGRQVL
jgi:hypothetical protein